uniref:Uncharacterized protein n=1 Tax=Thermofilum pendens TaxID=2269 RepID=A0A7C4BBR4_THEPE
MRSVEGRLSKVEGRLGGVEEHLKGVEARLGRVEEHLDSVEKSLGSVWEGLRSIEKRLDRVEAGVEDLRKEVGEKFRKLEEYIDVRVERLGRAFSGYQEFLVEYLSVKGVVSPREAEMLKNEAARLSLLAVNPFTKEEWEKLKKYLEKNPEDFTLEEALEFRELGRKAIAEYWDRPEAYKLHLYTCVVYGLTLRKLEEEKARRASPQ